MLLFTLLIMIKGLYAYRPYRNLHNGFMQSISVVCFDSLARAREVAISSGVSDSNGDRILRSYIFRGLEDRDYSIND